MFTNELRNRVRAKLEHLGRLYCQNPGLILTEGDLQAHVFRLLHEIPELSQLRDTLSQGFQAPALHTECSLVQRWSKIENQT